jgi:hypothetical protein
MAKIKSLKKKKVTAMPRVTDTPFMFEKKSKKRREVLAYNDAIDKEKERREKVRESLRR